MHNLKIEIDEKIKEQIYQYAGFGFSHSLLSDQELNYENVLKAMDLGPEFSRICRVLKLDPKVADEYVKKYIIHLIIRDLTNLTFPDENMLKKLQGQEIKGQKIEDILEEIFFKSPPDLYNTLSYVQDFFTTEQIESKLERTYDWNSIDENPLTSEYIEMWQNNSRKIGSFYPLYVKYAPRKSRLAQSLVKRYGDITDHNKEIKNKQIHFERFIKALELAEFDTSQDIWSFEYKTYLFMLNKISSYKDIDNLDEKYFHVLASLILVGDIRLKLLLMDTLFKNDSWLPYKNKLSEILLLSFIIIPYCKEFIKENLMGLIPKSNSTSVNDNFEMEMVNLKKELYIYQTLKGENCYHGESLISEFGINIKDEITVNAGLKGAWQKIEKTTKAIDKNYNNIFHTLSTYLSEFESFLDCYNQDELTEAFKVWLGSGMIKATKEYRDKVIKNKNDNYEIEFYDVIFKGKTDEETKKIKLKFEENRQINQKKLNEEIEEELDNLGIDTKELKAISKKYNCSITIEPEKIINKPLHNVDR